MIMKNNGAKVQSKINKKKTLFFTLSFYKKQSPWQNHKNHYLFRNGGS